MEKMKAIVCTQYGSPEVLKLQEVAKPTPQEQEVLIKIHACTVTAADSMMRQGVPYIGRLFIGLRKPKHPVTGTGFAGEIVAVGQGVSNWKIGDKVFGESIFGAGTNAEYLCMKEDGIMALIPENQTYGDAASIADGALTSLNLLRERAHIQAGQRVLIIGASGSLGTAAVQLAKELGAFVSGVCSTKNLDLVKSLGADEVIDYTQTDFTKTGETYDIIYDTVGKSSFPYAKNSLSETGIFLTPVMSLPTLFFMIKTSLFGQKKVKFDATGTRPVPVLRGMLQELKEMMAQGKFRTVIDRHYPLEELAEAHRYVDTGRKRGNLVIDVCLPVGRKEVEEGLLSAVVENSKS